MIKCCVCQCEFKRITPQHLQKHKMTMQDYRHQFPCEPLTDESIIMRGERNSFFGKHHTEELKQWQREHFTGKKSPLCAQKIAEKWKDPNGVYRKLMKSKKYSSIMSAATQVYWNSNRSDAHREKNADNLRKRRPTYENEIRRIQSTHEFRKQVSDRLKLEWETMPWEIKSARIQKQVDSMMFNGTLTSKVELELFQCLKESFPETKHAVWIHKSLTNDDSMWNIDFYIPEIDTYVQLDGVYWHGLDRPLEEIKNSHSKRDQAIYGKWLRDRKQDDWFSLTNKRLIRITDIEFNSDPESCMKRIKGI